MTRLAVVPCELAEANAFVKAHHRHHRPVVGHKFSIAIADDLAEIRGVAIVGRPVARNLDDGLTLEVTRCCTDGVPNGCSMLYAACWRAAKAMGYERLGTYILASETGTSLRAAGWSEVGRTSGGSWSRGERPRVDLHPLEPKLRFEVSA